MMKMKKMVMMIARKPQTPSAVHRLYFFLRNSKTIQRFCIYIKLVPTFEGLILREKVPKFSEREREREREREKEPIFASYKKWMMQMMMEILPLVFGFVKDSRVAADDDDDDDNLCFFLAHEGHPQKKYLNFCFLQKWGWNCSYE
jgi:hypothetical protein